MAVESRPATRCLVACAECKRQYDCKGLAAKSRFHCSCGVMIEVPRFEGHDAAVVRCSSCGAPRTANGGACGHCGSDYTLHERDLQTICSGCMTHVSDKARFCHHCGTAISCSGTAGAATEHNCPACGVKHKLNSRALGQTDISLLECPGCAGIWIGEETFELLAEKSRQRVLPEQLTTGPAGKRAGSAKQDGSMYRRCPRCAKHMNRRNFGHRSGIVIDTCKEHGFWFDAHELDRVLRWIRQGGEQRAARRQADQERQAERQSRVRYDRESRSAGPGTFESGLKREPTFGIGDLIGLFFDV